MNDDQNLNPTVPTPATPTPVPDTASAAAAEPIKLDEFGVPQSPAAPDPAPQPPAPPEVPTMPELPPQPEPVTPTLPPLEPPAPQGGEDVPLAFAAAPSLPTSPMGEVTPAPATVPPIAMPPVEQTTTVIKPKKGFPKLIVGIVAALILVVGGGLYGYNYYNGELPSINILGGKNQKSEAERAKNQAAAKKAKQDKNEVYQDRIDGAKGANNFDGNVGTYNKTHKTNLTSAEYQALKKSGVISGNKVASAKIVPCTSTAKSCTCGGGSKVCFDTSGYCGDEKNSDNSYTYSDQTRLTGLCAISSTPLWMVDPNCATKADDPLRCNAVPVNLNDPNKPWLNDGVADKIQENAHNDGTQTGDATVYYCPGKFDDLSGGCNELNAYNLGCFCGTIQIDTPGVGFESYSMSCGCGGGGGDNPTVEVSPSPSATPRPTLACTSLTKNKADSAIGIGTAVTLTCVGSVTPAGATNLTYKFRYNINSGSWINLTNTTATTAVITPNQCGTYSAQCQACGTINGVVTCDPIWGAAGTQ